MLTVNWNVSDLFLSNTQSNFSGSFQICSLTFMCIVSDIKIIAMTVVLVYAQDIQSTNQHDSLISISLFTQQATDGFLTCVSCEG